MYRAFLLVAAVVACAIGCQTEQVVDIATEKQALSSVMEEINTAWETEDLEAFSRIASHDAEMVNFGMDVSERWVGWDQLEMGLRQQFEVFSNTEVSPHNVDIHVSETGRTAWLAQAMKISTKFMGSPISLEARITAVFEKQEADWRLVQFHYSIPISEAAALGM